MAGAGRGADGPGIHGGTAAQRADKGVLITAGASPAPRMTLRGWPVEASSSLAGTRLAELIIEHEVGVTSEELRIPKIDTDYFEGEYWLPEPTPSCALA
jgi:restriction system protein